MKSFSFFKIFFGLFLCISSCELACAQARGSIETSIEKILEIYNEKDVVLFSESHGNKEVHDFLRAFVSYPKTIEVVDYIVVEFGNAFYQEIADRYIFGEQVSKDSLALIWRTHTVPLTWDSPVYEKFFQQIRKVNMSRQDGQKLRVLLGDPPINWSEVNTPEEYEHSLSMRGLFPYQLIKETIIEDGKKGFVIIGGIHILPVDLRTGLAVEDPNKASLGQHLKQNYLDKVFGIWAMSGENTDWKAMGFEKKYHFHNSQESGIKGESFYSLYGGDLYVQVELDGEKTWAPLAKDKWVKIDEVVEAVLFLGSENTTIGPDTKIYHADYLKDLERRVKIIDSYFGFNFYQDELNRLKASN